MNTTENTDNNKDERSVDLGRGFEFDTTDTGEYGGKVCDGCFKLHVTDWLKDYPANLPEDIFEVRFKNTRRAYYQNVNGLPLKEGDVVAVEASPGHDIGIVSLTGDMVAKQMRRVGFNPMNGEFKKIYRKAKPYDIEKWKEAIALEHSTMIRARQIAAEMNLNMKIGDVEYQGDKIKAIFYYIADERVDFRELIKVFADVFRIRVEMKQIGARQEAGRIGGLGSCGRELCCASWISSFMSVTTNAARTQDISLNPQKLAGQCSKLKCCLIYEYDDYMDARKEFPRVNEPLQTLDGDYFFIKNDILARTMSFSTAPGTMAGMVTLPIDRVREIMKLNAKGVKPEKIDSDKNYNAKKDVEPGFVNVIGEDSITRFDSARKKKSKKKGRGDRQPNGGVEAQPGGGKPDNGRGGAEGRRPDGQRRGEGGRNGNGGGSGSQEPRRNADAKGAEAANGQNRPNGGQQNRNANQRQGNNGRNAGQAGGQEPREGGRNNKPRGGNRGDGKKPQQGEGVKSAQRSAAKDAE